MSRQTWRMRALLGAMGLPLLVLAVPQVAWAGRTLFVANNAVDSATCGTSSEPCRSISRAIALARDGDRIRVRPGRYGDLNGDGDFSDPGEEAAEFGTGCRCMIRVDKRLRLESTDGAEVTVLDAGGAVLDVVNITASKVVFGGNGKGFTLTGARKIVDDDGIGLDVLAERGVRVIDNIAVDNQDTGFTFHGSRHTARNNLATANGQGFVLAFTEEGHTLSGNVASAHGNEGMFGHGFTIFGNNHSIVSNRSIGNDGMGFLLLSTSSVGATFKENEAIGNRGAGIWVLQGAGPSLHGNNLFGNLGEAIGVFFPATPNCGLVNDSGSTVDATLNFWGASTGPGPDPADDAGPGSICDRSGETLVEPFLTGPSIREGELMLLGPESRSEAGPPEE